MSTTPGREIVGNVPCLPWPLSASAWWTVPVRAEYLAVVRIGMGLVLLYDQLFGYLPCLDDLYGADSMGAPELFRGRTEAPRWRWSLFYGLDHSVLSSVALVVWLALTLWIAVRLATLPSRGGEPPPRQGSFRELFGAWLLAGVVYVLGLWIRETAPGGPGRLAWMVPAILFGAASALMGACYCRFRSDRGYLIGCWTLTLVLLQVGVLLVWPDSDQLGQIIRDLLVGWGENFTLIRVVFFVWMVSTACLCLGLATRPSAVIVWVLAVSFSTLNPEAHNSKGDSVRDVILFYLMLCPCGAAWSLDRLLQRRRGRLAGPIYVAPWPLRLLLIQLVIVYFFTGLIKLFSADWWRGDTLYYVLADLVLSRSSLAQLPVPSWFLRASTWFVLFWEVTFPLWVMLPWTRVAAFVTGALFHLGTLALMELGGFEWYVFVLYLPLLPWSRWLRDPGPVPAEPAGAPSMKQRLLGLFVLWQVVFLGVGNVVSYLRYASEQVLEEDREGADEIAPDWASQKGHLWDLQQKVGALPRLWGQLTAQELFWGMYMSAPRMTDLPAVELRFRHDPDFPSGRTEKLMSYSDYEPADPNRYFRFGERRASRFEQTVVPRLEPRDELSAEERNQEWATAIAKFVSDEHPLIRAYLHCRVRRMRAQNPGLPQPDEVVLYVRQFRVNPPEEAPPIWQGPVTIPIARWRPGKDGRNRALEAYNPATRRFEVLPLDVRQILDLDPKGFEPGRSLEKATRRRE